MAVDMNDITRWTSYWDYIGNMQLDEYTERNVKCVYFIDVDISEP